MIEIENISLDECYRYLKPYQRYIIEQLVVKYGIEKAAEEWINARGPMQTVTFGGVVEVLIDKSPFLVVLAELLPVILQKVRFVLALVEEIVPFIYDGFKPPAPDCFGLFRHGSVEVAFTLIPFFKGRVLNVAVLHSDIMLNIKWL